MPDPVSGTIAAASVGSALIGSSSANRAASAQSRSDAAAIAEQRRQFDTLMGLSAPQRQVGNQALNVLASAFIPGFAGLTVSPEQQGFYAGGASGAGSSLSGIGGLAGGLVGGLLGGGGSRTQNRPIAGADLNRLLEHIRANPQDYDEQHEIQGLLARNRPGAREQILSAVQGAGLGYFAPGAQGGAQTMAPIGAGDLSQMFQNLPGTQFLLDETQRGVGNSFAARGGAFGGNAATALGDRISNLAAERTFGMLSQLAGYGNQGAQMAGNAALQTGSNISNLLSNQGAARASGIMGQGQALNNALQGGLSNFLLYRMTQ